MHLASKSYAMRSLLTVDESVRAVLAAGRRVVVGLLHESDPALERRAAVR